MSQKSAPLSADNLNNNDLVKSLLLRCLQDGEVSILNDCHETIQDLIPYVPSLDSVINVIRLRIEGNFSALLPEINETINEINDTTPDWHNFIFRVIIDIFQDYLESNETTANDADKTLFEHIFDALFQNILTLDEQADEKTKSMAVAFFKRAYNSEFLSILMKAKLSTYMTTFCYRNYPLMLPDLLPMMLSDQLIRPLGVRRLFEADQCRVLTTAILLRYSYDSRSTQIITKFFFDEHSKQDLEFIKIMMKFSEESPYIGRATSISRPSTPRKTKCKMDSYKSPTVKDSDGRRTVTPRGRVSYAQNMRVLPKLKLVPLPFNKDDDITDLDRELMKENLLVLLKNLIKFNLDGEYHSYTVRILKKLQELKHKMTPCQSLNLEMIDAEIVLKYSGPSEELVNRLADIFADLNQFPKTYKYRKGLFHKLIHLFFTTIQPLLDDRAVVAEALESVAPILESIFSILHEPTKKLVILMLYENALCLEKINQLVHRAETQLSRILDFLRTIESKEKPEDSTHHQWLHLRHRILFDHRRLEIVLDPYKTLTSRRDAAVLELEHAKKVIGQNVAAPTEKQLLKTEQHLKKCMQLLLPKSANQDLTVKIESQPFDRYFEIWIAVIEFARQLEHQKIIETACQHIASYELSNENAGDQINSVKLARLNIVAAENMSRLGRFEDTIPYLKKSLEIASELNNPNFIQTVGDYFWNFCVYASKITGILENDEFSVENWLLIKDLTSDLLDKLFKSKLDGSDIFKNLVHLQGKCLINAYKEMIASYQTAVELKKEKDAMAEAQGDAIDSKDKKKKDSAKNDQNTTLTGKINFIQQQGLDITPFDGIKGHLETYASYIKSLVSFFDGPNFTDVDFVTENIESYLMACKILEMKAINLNIKENEDCSVRSSTMAIQKPRDSRSSILERSSQAMVQIKPRSIMLDVVWLLVQENSDFSFDDTKNIKPPPTVPKHSSLRFFNRIAKVFMGTNDQQAMIYLKACEEMVNDSTFENFSRSQNYRLKTLPLTAAVERVSHVNHQHALSATLKSAELWFDFFTNYMRQSKISSLSAQSDPNHIKMLETVLKSVQRAVTAHQKINKETCASANNELRVKLYLLYAQTKTNHDAMIDVLSEGITMIQKGVKNERLELFKQRAFVKAYKLSVDIPKSLQNRDTSKGMKISLDDSIQSINNDLIKLKDAGRKQEFITAWKKVLDIISPFASSLSTNKCPLTAALKLVISVIPESNELKEMATVYHFKNFPFSGKCPYETDSYLCNAYAALNSNYYEATELTKDFYKDLFMNTIVKTDNQEPISKERPRPSKVTSKASARASKMKLSKPEKKPLGTIDDFCSDTWVDPFNGEIEYTGMTAQKISLAFTLVKSMPRFLRPAGFKLLSIHCKNISAHSLTAAICLELAELSTGDNKTFWKNSAQEYFRKVSVSNDNNFDEMLILVQSLVCHLETDLALSLMKKFKVVPKNAMITLNLKLVEAICNYLKNGMLPETDWLKNAMDFKMINDFTIDLINLFSDLKIDFAVSVQLYSMLKSSLRELIKAGQKSDLQIAKLNLVDVLFQVKTQDCESDAWTVAVQDLHRNCSLVGLDHLLAELYFELATNTTCSKKSIIYAASAIESFSKHISVLAPPVQGSCVRKAATKYQILMIKALTEDLDIRVEEYFQEYHRQAAQSQLERTVELYNENIDEDTWREVDTLTPLRIDILGDFQRVLVILFQLPESESLIGNLYASKINQLSLKLKCGPVNDPSFSVDNVNEGDEKLDTSLHGERPKVRAIHAPSSINRFYDIAHGGIPVKVEASEEFYDTAMGLYSVCGKVDVDSALRYLSLAQSIFVAIETQNLIEDVILQNPVSKASMELRKIKLRNQFTSNLSTNWLTSLNDTAKSTNILILHHSNDILKYGFVSKISVTDNKKGKTEEKPNAQSNAIGQMSLKKQDLETLTGNLHCLQELLAELKGRKNSTESIRDEAFEKLKILFTSFESTFSSLVNSLEKQLEKSEGGLLILMDPSLAELPIEKLFTGFIKEGNLSYISRDFSVETFYKRTTFGRDSGDAKKVESNTKGKKGLAPIDTNTKDVVIISDRQVDIDVKRIFLQEQTLKYTIYEDKKSYSNGFLNAEVRTSSLLNIFLSPAGIYKKTSGFIESFDLASLAANSISDCSCRANVVLDGGLSGVKTLIILGRLLGMNVMVNELHSLEIDDESETVKPNIISLMLNFAKDGSLNMYLEDLGFLQRNKYDWTVFYGPILI